MMMMVEERDVIGRDLLMVLLGEMMLEVRLRFCGDS